MTTDTVVAAKQVGSPLPTSAVLMSASRHISSKCAAQNKAFLDCKRADQNPEKCLHRGEEVSQCVLFLLKELHDKCGKQMDGFSKCLDYYGNEFEMCRKQQEEFYADCPL